MRSKYFLVSFLALFFLGFSETSGQTQNNDNDHIKSLIAKKRSFNKTYGFGYKIQLFNGNERQARSIRGRFGVEFPNISSKLKYDAPEWKVQVGNYKTRLEADKDLILFSEKFSGIIVIPMGR